MASPAAEPPEGDEAPPAPFRSWGALHAIVLASLAVVIAALALVTRAYR